MGKKSYILDFSPGETELALRQALQGDIIGQEEAIERAVRHIMKTNAADGCLRDPFKPAGTLFFLGPTGVGKTYLVKVLAKHFFGSPDAITRVDCSEFQHEHEIARLIGAPAGYIGHNQEPYLNQWKIDRPGFEAWAASSKGYRQLTAISARVEEIDSDLIELLANGKTLDAEAKAAQARREEIKKREAAGTRVSKEELEQLIKDMNIVTNKFEEFNKKMKELRREKQTLEQMQQRLAGQYSYHPGSYPAIVLFDEVEKAHPALFKLMLTIIDEARLTTHSRADIGGNEVCFHNTLVCFTSNLAQTEIGKTIRGNATIGFGRPTTDGNASDIHEDIQKMVLERLEDTNFSRLPPELLARIGRENIIIFRNLTRPQIREGLDRILVPRLLERYNAALPIMLDITESTREWLVDRSQEKNNKMFGMRSMESVFSKYVEENLAILAAKTVAEGGIVAGDIITVELERNSRGEEALVFYRDERTASQKTTTSTALTVLPRGSSGRRVIRPFQLLRKKS